jgi:hypothetical protein
MSRSHTPGYAWLAWAHRAHPGLGKCRHVVAGLFHWKAVRRVRNTTWMTQHGFVTLDWGHPVFGFGEGFDDNDGHFSVLKRLYGCCESPLAGHAAKAAIKTEHIPSKGRQKNGDSRMKTRIGFKAYSSVPILLSTRLCVQTTCLNLQSSRALAGVMAGSSRGQTLFPVHSLGSDPVFCFRNGFDDHDSQFSVLERLYGLLCVPATRSAK